MNSRIALILLVLLLAVSISAAQTKSAAPKPAAADLKALMQAQLRAWETLDPAQAARFYAKDAGLAFYDILPFKYTGWQEYAKGVPPQFAAYKSGKFILHDDVKIHQSGGLAWTTATLDMEMFRKDGGRETLRDLRWTLIWEKRGAQWLIVHEHLSVPMGVTPVKK